MATVIWEEFVAAIFHVSLDVNLLRLVIMEIFHGFLLWGFTRASVCFGYLSLLWLFAVRVCAISCRYFLWLFAVEIYLANFASSVKRLSVSTKIWHLWYLLNKVEALMIFFKR